MLQIVKTVVAAVLAWELSTRLLDLPHPYIAPWSAIFAVHATVHGSLRSGFKQTTATGVGLLVAYVAGHTLGVNTLTLALGLLAAMVLGRWRLVADENLTAMTTVLFVLTLGGVDQGQVLAVRLGEVALGAASGLAMNLLVAPLWTASAASSVDRIAGRVERLLLDVATGLRENWTTTKADAWLAETTRIVADIGSAWQIVKLGNESRWWNPRRLRRKPSRREARAEELLAALEHAVADVRSLARTLWRHSPDGDEEGGLPAELAGVAVALESLAQLTADLAADRRAEVDERLREVGSALPAETDLSAYPGLGSVAANVRNIATELAHAG